jgi:hypothetical protein
LGLRLDVVLAGLASQHSLGLITVSLALSVFLISILDGDLFVHKILAVHASDCAVGGFKVCKRDEAVALGQIRIVSGNLFAG